MYYNIRERITKDIKPYLIDDNCKLCNGNKDLIVHSIVPIRYVLYKNMDKLAAIQDNIFIDDILRDIVINRFATVCTECHSRLHNSDNLIYAIERNILSDLIKLESLLHKQYNKTAQNDFRETLNNITLNTIDNNYNSLKLYLKLFGSMYDLTLIDNKVIVIKRNKLIYTNSNVN